MTVDSLDRARSSGPLHLAIGMFDGVHLGHQAVVESAAHLAARTGGTAGVLTFDPHPSHLFRPDEPTPLMLPRQAKERLLTRCGVGLIIFQRFTPELAAVKADAFPAMLRRHLPALRSLHIGENFRFGRGRQGDVAALVSACEPLGIDVFSADRVKWNGEPISSTRVRAALAEGRVDEANAMLGYNYFSTGPAVPGRQLGRQLGFPTLNQCWAPELRPRLGVYVARLRRESGGGWQLAVANYGLRPTVEDAAPEPLLEAHVLGDTDLDAGDDFLVEWLRFLRPERKFDSLEALCAQINADRRAAMDWHAAAR